MSKQNRPQPKAPPDPNTYTVALRPRPKLLIALSILFAAWVGFLLVLYFTTIK
jgi:hypothetical protein